MLDEIDDPNWHQWLCICRLLMFHHPLVGADAAECCDKGPPLKPGWNRRRSPLKDFDTYTLIDKVRNMGETRFSPPSDEEIHCAREYYPLDETKIWSIARRLSVVLDQTPVLESIVQSAFFGRAALRAACHGYMASYMVQLEKFGNDWFRWAPRAIVDAYLRFNVPGVVAATTLGAVLTATVEFLCTEAGLVETAPIIRAALSGHFSDMTYRLLRQRRSYNVSGYYQLSYLASLYSLTAVTVVDGIEKKLDSGRLGVLKRSLLNTEEKACDLLNTSLFLFPARYSTVGILKLMAGYCHLTGKSMKEAVKELNLHPALVIPFNEEAKFLSVESRDDDGGGAVRASWFDGRSLEEIQERVHSRYIEESHRLESVDMEALLNAEFNPIHERINSLLKPVMSLEEIREVLGSWQWP